MFVHEGKLVPALAASDYVDPAVWELERAAIFAAQWHVVGCLDELRDHGAQLARAVLTVPVVVRNESGTLVAFRNVCPHRHSLLVEPGRSRAPVLRCQYHGWEFRADGRLGHLPDGGSFRGLKAHSLCLEPVHVTTLGPLVFINLASSPRSLRSTFGPIFDELQTRLAGMELTVRQQTRHDANWKIPVENAVESYHVPMLHPDSFTDYLAERHHEHELEATYSRYRPTAAPSKRERLAFVGFRLMLRGELAQRYQHVHVLPNYLVTYAGIYVELVVIEPLAVDSCVREAYGFVPKDVRANPVSRGLDLVHRRILRRAADTILAEDSRIFPALQQGLANSPFSGVLSAREERVHHFQRHVARAIGRDLAERDSNQRAREQLP